MRCENTVGDVLCKDGWGEGTTRNPNTRMMSNDQDSSYMCGALRRFFALH